VLDVLASYIVVVVALVVVVVAAVVVVVAAVVVVVAAVVVVVAAVVVVVGAIVVVVANSDATVVEVVDVGYPCPWPFTWQGTIFQPQRQLQPEPRPWWL